LSTDFADRVERLPTNKLKLLCFFFTAPKYPEAGCNAAISVDATAIGRITLEQFWKSLPKYLNGLHPTEIPAL